MKSSTLTTIVVVVVVLIIGYFLYSQQTTNNNTDQTQSTQTTPSAVTGETKELKIGDYAFIPQSVTIKKGTTVTWTNIDAVKHTVTSDSGNELNSPDLAKGDTYTHIFTTPGVYKYHCTMHPNFISMKGTITVTE